MSDLLEQAVTAWNASAARAKWRSIRILTVDRERKLRRILRGSLELWMEGLAKAEASDFLCGRTDYVFNIDTMLRDNFFARLVEGAYDNRGSAVVYKSPETLLWEARLARWKPGALWLGIWGAPPTDPACEAPAAVVEAWRARQNMN